MESAKCKRQSEDHQPMGDTPQSTASSDGAWAGSRGGSCWDKATTLLSITELGAMRLDRDRAHLRRAAAIVEQLRPANPSDVA